MVVDYRITAEVNSEAGKRKLSYDAITISPYDIKNYIGKFDGDIMKKDDDEISPASDDVRRTISHREYALFRVLLERYLHGNSMIGGESVASGRGGLSSSRRGVSSDGVSSGGTGVSLEGGGLSSKRRLRKKRLTTATPSWRPRPPQETLSEPLNYATWSRDPDEYSTYNGKYL